MRSAAGLAVDDAILADADQPDAARAGGGRTFFDFTRPGLAASSSSVIQRMKTGWSARTSSISRAVTSSLV